MDTREFPIDSSFDYIKPSKAYLDHLDRWVDPDHEAALTVVRQWVRFCPYPEWVLLELPEGNWGALWHQGYGTEYTDMVLRGDYSLLALVVETYVEVMRYMANNLMFPPESHATMIALQRSTL
ncbi:hypothetical protein [Pseudomonas profundi]|uniref:hypothetical protein n=1 Tax=Pseudomonas profundi TaxID=1981513 RepID=UPI00123BA193|nr:hypothetical protein [Pseudomonas profundi]